MTTWYTGRRIVTKRLAETEVPLSDFEGVRVTRPARVPGTGIFRTARAEGTPPILVHHLTHNKCCTSRSSPDGSIVESLQWIQRRCSRSSRMAAFTGGRPVRL